MAAIFFNSKTFKNYQGLSNLMGGAEFDYMSARFLQQTMKDLFTELKNCDRETFLEWLQILQPGKKWTPRKLAYWFTPDGEPIRGILAQLLGSMVRRKEGKLTHTSKHRQNIVRNKLGIDTIEVAPELTDDNKKIFMKECLMKKYSIEPYRSLLFVTGSVNLHEKPIRGKGNNWTSPGGDWLGQLLMEVRTEIVEQTSKKRPIVEVRTDIVEQTSKKRSIVEVRTEIVEQTSKKRSIEEINFQINFQKFINRVIR